MPSWAPDFEKEAQLQLLTLYNISRSWFSWFILFLQSALCLASHRQMQPLLFLVSSPQIKRDSSISCKPNKAFLLSFEAAAFLPSFSFCPLSMCSFIRCSANSISPPKINISSYWGFSQVPYFIHRFSSFSLQERKCKWTRTEWNPQAWRICEWWAKGQREMGKWKLFHQQEVTCTGICRLNYLSMKCSPWRRKCRFKNQTRIFSYQFIKYAFNSAILFFIDGDVSI